MALLGGRRAFHCKIIMDRDQLKTDLEYITQRREMPEDETLTAVLGRLDAMARSSDIPARLEHYLSQRSYLKALAWLENPDTPHHP